MGRNTKRLETLADRMRAAGVEPLYVSEVQSLHVGYAALRGTCKLLNRENRELRDEIKALKAKLP